MIGLEIGSYKLVSKIGEGGMGEVYLAEHNLLRRKAAVKLLLEEFNQDENVVKRFINEAKATSQIQHPGIVQIFDFGKTPQGSTYMIMEMLEGETLHARGRKLGRLPIADAISIARQMAEALGAAHALKVVHRDLKPENVFLVPDPAMPGGERVKILDFGIAKMLDPSAGAAHTRTGSVLGTPVYMSPEQCMAAPGIDHRADLYSLGCVFFQLLCGRPPFDVSGIGELLGAHIYTPPPVPSTLTPAISPMLDAIVLRLLAKKPEGRYASTAELIAALDALPLTEADSRQPEPGAPREVPEARSGPEAATMIGSGLARATPPAEVTTASSPAALGDRTEAMPAPDLPQEPPAAAAPVVPGPAPVVTQPLEQPRKEITTLGGSAGESTPRLALPQPDRPRSNSLVTMAVAFGITAVLAIGAYLVFGGKGDPPLQAPAYSPPPAAAPADLATDAG